MHIFGKAGYGKTNLACAVCSNALAQGIPSLLILASDIRVESDLYNWITDSLHTEYDLISLLGLIDNLGFLKQKKIPVVIDGLNEKYPDASYWRSQLEYLLRDVEKFRNILLITTSRESYTEEIFDKPTYKEVSNNYYLEGFIQNDLSIAINKYFSKYKITINNDDYDKSIFQHPLLLKIFCTVHKGKTFTFSPTNIYETMESYYVHLINKIVESFPGQKSIICKVIEDRIDNFCLKLLDENSKQINYKNDFFNIFDPDFSPSNQPKILISDKILDEGMFIKREMRNNKEYVEFTHDFIGGYTLAKAIALSTDDTQEITDKLLDQTVMANVINFKTGDFQHPLSEDILKNLIYFFKQKTGGQLYDLLKFDSVLKLSLSMLEVSDPSEKEQQGLIEELLSSENKDLTITFFEEAVSKITDKNDYCYVDILFGLISELSAKEIDLYWSETIRKNSDKILNYLNTFLNTDLKYNDINHEIFLFLPCLFSSTHRLIRDAATKLLVKLGEYALEIIFDIYKKFEYVSDLYIHERLMAALCGIILRKGGAYKTISLKIAKYLEKKYFKECATTHLLILDYADTILHYASSFHGYNRKHSIDPHLLNDWLKDDECTREVKGDGKATWGYGPIHMDFAKYTIGHHIATYRSSRDKLPSLKEALAMIIWRMKNLGYDEKIFENIDRECMKSRHGYSRHDNSMSIERYGKKYSWIAYFELYGQFVLKGMIETEGPRSFRVSSIDIDPTFPELIRKEQLVTDCFLPRRCENLQEWVNRSDKGLLQKIYRVKSSEKNWVLIHARNHQKNTDKVRIDIDVEVLLFLEKKKKKALNIFKNQTNIHFERLIYEHYYLFHGEIPWGKLLQTKSFDKLLDDSDEIWLYSPFSWFTWEGYHSKMNDLGNVPFLSKFICDEYNLKYDLNTLTFFDKDEAVTRYNHDTSSHYYFINKSHLDRFLKKYNLSLAWLEFVRKDGDYGYENTKGLEPSFNDIESITIYK